MATTIKIKNSVTAAGTPSSLAQGELAVNITDKKMWVGNAATTPIQILGAGVTNDAGGSNTQVQYNSSGSLAGSANMTFSGTALTLANDAVISGLDIGKGGGSVSTNTRVGAGALSSNTSGLSNVAMGYLAFNANTTGQGGIAIGSGALQNNTTGNNNAGVGINSLLTNTTGQYNSAYGTASLQSNTTGSNNVAIGYTALLNNTTALNNTAVGFQAGYSGTTGADNVHLGYNAGYSRTTGAGNTLLGDSAGYSLTTGHANTFVGSGQYASNGAGYYVTTGQYNTVLGGYDGNQGGLDIRTSSNNIVLSDGGGGIGARWVSGGGWFQSNNSATWSITSDARIKENIVDLPSGLDVITALRPVEFDYIISKKHDIGFIAQEYQQILPSQVIQDPSGDETIKALTNGEPTLVVEQNLVPYLVKAIQELNAKITALENK
jgi:hypothetical protein